MTPYEEAERHRLLEENVNLRADNEAFQQDIRELVVQAMVMQSLIAEQNKTIQKLMMRVKV